MKQNSKADNFYNALKNNPQEILDWCDEEIAEYRKLKKIIKKGMNLFSRKKN